MGIIETQINILIDKCRLGEGKFPGAENVARKLLTYGACIVAGDGRIWPAHGGGSFGDFISYEDVDHAEACKLLKLDLKGFLSSTAVVQMLEQYSWELVSRVEEINTQLECVRAMEAIARGETPDLNKHITTTNNAD